MSIYDKARYGILERGYEYFKNGNIISVEELGDDKVKFLIEGNADEPYVVIYDKINPTKSTCTCPYCDGHPRIICKHKIAAALTFDEEKVKELQEEERREQKYIDERNKEIAEYNRKVQQLKNIARNEAVLKFQNMSDDEKNNYIVEHLTDEIYKEYANVLRDEYDKIKREINEDDPDEIYWNRDWY